MTYTSTRCPHCTSPHVLAPSALDRDGHFICLDCGEWWHQPESVLPEREASNTQPKEKEREK